MNYNHLENKTGNENRKRFQGVHDEAQRIAQGYDNDQENDIF